MVFGLVYICVRIRVGNVFNAFFRHSYSRRRWLVLTCTGEFNFLILLLQLPSSLVGFVRLVRYERPRYIRRQDLSRISSLKSFLEVAY